jgi:hypothetical protein
MRTDLKDIEEKTIEATKIGKEIKDTIKQKEITAGRLHNQSNGTPSYAAVAGRGLAIGNRQNIQILQTQRTLSTQTQREIIVNIRDPSTITRLRAMNPRNLKAHIDRAIEQSNNVNIQHIKIASSNQLKSGDLSVKATTITDTNALRQFADDWTHKIGSGATARIPTFGVIAHGVRTSTMNMDRAEEVKRDILQDNRAFIPFAEIKYVGWLTRSALSKSTSSIIIDEGLIWQGEALRCELYDRQCRLRQCYKCQNYGHIGTQCKASTACGYCAQEHSSRDCPTRTGDGSPRKCATCKGAHEAWNHQCPVRQEEITKLKSAYELRPQYHPAPGNNGYETQPQERESEWRNNTGRRQVGTNSANQQESQIGQNAAKPRKGRKRLNQEDIITPQDTDTERGESNQRPQRTLVPSRRALEAGDAGNPIRINSSQTMEIDTDL